MEGLRLGGQNLLTISRNVDTEEVQSVCFRRRPCPMLIAQRRILYK